MKNSLVQNTFIQYKHREYYSEEIFKKFAEGMELGREIDVIKAYNPHQYQPVQIDLEAIIQRLSNEKLPKLSYITPSKKRDILELSLKYTRDYGFLTFPKYLESINYDVQLNNFGMLYEESDEEYKVSRKKDFQGEKAETWVKFVKTMHYAMKRISINDYHKTLDPYEVFHGDDMVDYYLSQINTCYNFETQSISLQPSSLASAIILFIVRDNKHLKSCENCKSLYFSKMSNAKFCNPNCRQQKRRSKNS